MDKIALYGKIFSQLIQLQQQNEEINARKLIQKELQAINIQVVYDADMAEILKSYINRLELNGNEQNIAYLLDKLVKELLIFQRDVEDLTKKLKLVIFYRNLSFIYVLDSNNLQLLVNCLQHNYKDEDILYQSQRDIQSILIMNLDQQFKNYLQRLNEQINKLIFNKIENKQKQNQLSFGLMNHVDKGIQQVEDNFDEFLNNIYEKEKLSQVNYKVLMVDEVNLIKEIISHMNLEQLFGLKYVYVQPYGSLVSGFSQNTSDIDISINTNCYLNERIFLTLIHSFMKNYLDKNSIKYQQLELIDVARIPLIHLVKFNENLDSNLKIVSIDICINNVLGCTNSQMLKVISQTHPLIPKLGIIIKKWAKTQELISKRNLTSYSFILIMISFLQKKEFIDSQFKQMIQQRQKEIEYKTQIKRTKEREENFETSLFYIKKPSILQQNLEDFKKRNPNKKTILDTNLSTLFTEFINYFQSTDERKRYIDIVEDYMLKNYDMSLYFYINDPIDKQHNPGERSKVVNLYDNIYINSFVQTKQELVNKNYELIFTQKLCQR